MTTGTWMRTSSRTLERKSLSLANVLSPTRRADCSAPPAQKDLLQTDGNRNGRSTASFRNKSAEIRVSVDRSAVTQQQPAEKRTAKLSDCFAENQIQRIKLSQKGWSSRKALLISSSRPSANENRADVVQMAARLTGPKSGGDIQISQKLRIAADILKAAADKSGIRRPLR